MVSYGRYDKTRRNPWPFAIYLRKFGIDAQYTMLDTPQQTGIVEKRNLTLLDIVCSMLANSNLPNYLWEEALRTMTYILNQVPSKYVPKTLFGLWSGKKPNLHHFCVWGYKAKMQIYNPPIKKLDPKTISGYFFGYCIGSTGSRFFCPSHTTRIVELDKAIYFEDDFRFDDSNGLREPQFREESIFISGVIVPDRDVFYPIVDEIVGQNDLVVDEQNIPAIIDAGAPLRRSQRIRRSSFLDDYEVYLQEHDFDINGDLYPITYE